MATELQIVSNTSLEGDNISSLSREHVPETSAGLTRNPSAPSRRDGSVPARQKASLVRSSSIIASVAGVTVLNTFGQSLLIVAIPQIARDLDIPSGQLFWPTAVGSLTLGCLLLVVGAIADAVGDRPIFLLGCGLHLAFGIGCARARNATDLITSRALQGVGLALCYPTATGMITRNFEEGKGRNIAFACFGGGNPIGYAIGLLLGGLFTKTVGWRYAYYFSLALNLLILVLAFFSLPADIARDHRLQRLKTGVDWVGLALISAQMSTISYVLASITQHSSLSSHRSLDVVLLVISIILIPLFILWVGRQERLGRPAIIPNSIWRRAGFSSVCVGTFLSWAMFNSVAFYVTLFMQEIQRVSALQTSLRFIPLVILSVSANVVVGFLVDKVTASRLAFGATVLSSAAPAIFAFTSPDWGYWVAMFPAMCLIPLSSDMFFNVANLVITSSFSSADQTLAGGVFSTVSQLGSSIGLAVTGAIAASKSSSALKHNGNAAGAQLDGIRAAFFTCFAAAIFSCVISTIGLRKSGKVGLKRE